MSLRAFCDELLADDSIRRDGVEGYANERLGERVVMLNDSQLRGMREVLSKAALENDTFAMTRDATTEVLERVTTEISAREKKRALEEAAVLRERKAIEKKRMERAAIEGELARFGSQLEHDPPWVLGIQRTESSAAVDFPTCTVAHAALGLRISVPGNPEALTSVKPPDVPEMRDPPSSVTDAIQAAIDAGALAHEDIDDDAWESLHLVDPRVVLRMVQSLAPADGLAGAGGAALVERLDAAEAGS